MLNPKMPEKLSKALVLALTLSKCMGAEAPTTPFVTEALIGQTTHSLNPLF